MIEGRLRFLIVDMKNNAARTFRVEAIPSGNWWSITVPEISGVFSQAKRLDQVEAAAREAISMVLDIEESRIAHLDIHVTSRQR